MTTPPKTATDEKEQASRSLEITEDEIHQKLIATKEEGTEYQDNILEQRKKKLKLTKRKNNSSEWACNQRKERFDPGLDYISFRKKAVPVKEMKKTIQKCF